MEIFGIAIVQVLFNFIGASLRWIYGLIWRTIFKKPKFSFKEYLYGPKKSSDYYDDFAHNGNNVLIGAIAFFIFASIIIKYNI
tara:strand:- start:283 stop:531 length:249 start_codon:yes stop_codon:yes gene_type:complete